jgi:hypothetical protein
MNRVILTFTLTLAASLAAATAQTVATAAIFGTVIGDSGRPLAGAKLVYTRMPTYLIDSSGRHVRKDIGATDTITLGPDGTFALTSLPAGAYSICAYGPQPDQVSGCNWNGDHLIQLADQQVVQNVVRVVYDASIITVRVSDPNGRIIHPDGRGNVQKERRFFLGVSTPSGYYERADLLSSGSGTSLFRIVIPNQQKVRLFIDSELDVAFNGSDLPSNNIAAGSAVETKHPTTFQIVPSGRSQITVDLTVR